MKGGGNSESEERRERRVTIRKIGVWIGGCVTPYLVVPAAEQPRLKQTKKQNSETSILRWASQLGLGATQETFRMSRAWEFLDLSVVFSRTPFHHSQAWIPSSSTQSPRHVGITHVEASLKQKATLLCIPRDTPWCVGRKKSRKSGRLTGPEQHPPHRAYTLATWAASGLNLI